MRLLSTDVMSHRRDHVDGDLIVIWRPGTAAPAISDELELDGLLYSVVAQVWPETGALGTVLRFRRLPF